MRFAAYHRLLLASDLFLLPIGLDITVVETVLILRSSFFHSRFGHSLYLTRNRTAKAIVAVLGTQACSTTKTVHFCFLRRDEAYSCLSIFMLVLKVLHSQSEWIMLPGKGKIVRRGITTEAQATHQKPFLK